LAGLTLSHIDRAMMFALKRKGFSDAASRGRVECHRDRRSGTAPRHGVRPVYKRVDTCAAEFAPRPPTCIPAMRKNARPKPSDRKKIMVLGGGPNRIGQGIEFDYCCVHAALAMREDGFETIMVNCNPETVSTDYNISDRLYFEPVTLEDVLEIVQLEKPEGVIVQFGGQTPLNLVTRLERLGVPVIGTSADAIDLAEDRERFQQTDSKAGSETAAELHRAQCRAVHDRSRPRSAIRWWCVPPMCWAVGPWKLSTTKKS
jgi:carbamoyl-phosphate synthase large subunit